MRKFLLVLFISLALCCAFSACKNERSIIQSEIINGELVLTYSDGSTENLGSVASALAQNGEKGDVGAQGEKGEPGQQGEQGADGITPQIRINAESNEWEISLDSGATWTSTEVKATGAQGEKGEDGITPQIRINIESNEWEISLDSGTTWTSTEVKATGAQGVPGAGSQDNAENSQELDFFPLPDGTYAVSIGKAIYLENIVIPATYKGKAVTKILDQAFRARSMLVSVTIPASVTSIGDGAFYNCAALQSVIFEGESQLVSIGNSAFQQCKALKYITIPAGVSSIGTCAFADCTVLSSITFECTTGWWVSQSHDATSGTDVNVSTPTSNDYSLTQVYRAYYWKRTTK